MAYGPAFEGERVRGDDVYLESGGGRTPMVEWVTSRKMEEVEDGRITVKGTELKDLPPGSKLPLAILVEVAGRQMQEDYEPILERQIHHLLNYAQGIMHIASASLPGSNQQIGGGERLNPARFRRHPACQLHEDFGRIFDSCSDAFNR